MTTQAPIRGLQDRESALGIVRKLYLALALNVRPPRCEDACAGGVPVCSYSEAEHIWGAIARHPDATLGHRVLLASRAWLLKSDGPAQFRSSQERQREVAHLRRSGPCPYLLSDGTCLLPEQPLECWVREIPQDARGPVLGTIAHVERAFPQKTGFLPSQLYCLAKQDDYLSLVQSGRINGAKAAVGELSPRHIVTS